MNTIPKISNFLRGQFAVAYRQTISNTFRNFKSNLIKFNPPPFSNDSISSLLLNNLVSYWKLDVGLPNSSPDSAGGNPVSGGIEVSNVAGKINNGGRIQPSAGGTSTCSTSGSNPEYQFSNGDFSIIQWFNLSSDPGLDVNLICKCNSVIPPGSIQGFSVSITAATRKLFASVGKATVFKSTAQTVGINLNQWYMVAVTFNLNNNLITLKIFDTSSLLDTVTVVAGIADYEPSGDTDIFRVASSRFGSGFIYLFDETGVWNKVLNDNEILTIWNSGLGKSYPFN